jgi:hypothetical protein
VALDDEDVESFASHHASAAWAANVLQPETTTTCGLASESVRRFPE